jgi:excisionase family DNA binding protein
VATAPSWLSTSAAAAYLGLASVAALYKRVERGQVPSHRWRRQLRFLRHELDALMEAGGDFRSARRVGSSPVCSVADQGDR